MSSDPIMVLAVADSDGKAVASPLFAAVKCSAGLVKRLRRLTELCRLQGLESIEFRDPDPPVYWDVAPGSALDGYVEDHTQWLVHGEHHSAELWGRRPSVEGDHGLLELLARSAIVDIEELESMRDQRTQFDVRDFDDTEAVLGTPFLLAVYEWLGARKVWPPDLPPPT